MVGRNITELEFRGPLVFAHVVLTKTLGVCRDREIRDKITRRMDL